MRTPSPDRIFRAVTGAVKNAAHGHPQWKLNSVMARSIAKRATGTLLADWQRGLAVQSPSEQAEKLVTASMPPFFHPTADRGKAGRGPSLGGGAQTPPRRSPLRLLHNKIGAMVKEAKYAGRTERTEALIEVLRLVAGHMRARS